MLFLRVAMSAGHLHSQAYQLCQLSCKQSGMAFHSTMHH